jgi:hypothetical protein
MAHKVRYWRIELNRCRKLIGIAGPPDPDFAKLRRTNGFVSLVMRMLSYGIRKAAAPATRSTS